MDLEKLKASLSNFKAEILNELKKTSEEGSTKFNEMETKLTAHVDKQIEEQKKRSLTLPGYSEEHKKTAFNIHKVVKASLNHGQWDKDAGHEQEVCRQLAEMGEQRSANASSGAAGGYLIPEESASEIIDLSIARTAVMELGPTIIRGLRGELPIPKVTGRPTMYWVGEEEAPTESNTTFGEITLRPKNAAAFTKMSQKLLYQSAMVAEKIVREQLVNAFTIGIETAAINGSGNNGEPKGITQYGSLTSTATLTSLSRSRFRVDDAQRMQKDIDVANMLKGNIGYLMRPEVLSGMMRERIVQFSGQSATEGQPTINPFMTRNIIEEALYGAKVRTTTLLGLGNTSSGVATDSNVVCGDWAQLILAFWEGFEIKASDVAGNAGGSALTQRQVWMVAHQSMDMNIKDQTGFCMIPDADTAEANW